MADHADASGGRGLIRGEASNRPAAGHSRRRLLAGGAGFAGALVVGAAGWRTARGQEATPAADVTPPLIYNGLAFNADESAYDFMGRYFYMRLGQLF